MTPLLSTMGARQQHLLTLLLHNKPGLTKDELAERLGITRTAVNQHIIALERDGLVAKTHLQKTKGRPGHLYSLTSQAIELFPKQYSWFSKLLLETLKKELSSEGLARYLRSVAMDLSAHLRHRLTDKSHKQQIAETAKIMNELAYDARLIKNNGAGSVSIEASNCVYHELAAEYPEVCDFDVALLTELLNSNVDHQECIAKGGHTCRFRFHPKAK